MTRRRDGQGRRRASASSILRGDCYPQTRIAHQQLAYSWRGGMPRQALSMVRVPHHQGVNAGVSQTILTGIRRKASKINQASAGGVNAGIVVAIINKTRSRLAYRIIAYRRVNGARMAYIGVYRIDGASIRNISGGAARRVNALRRKQ